MAIPFKFELGEVLKDVITGYEGVAVGRTQYFTDCNHYGLLARELDKDGKPRDWIWLDETRVVRSNKDRVEFKPIVPTSGIYPNAPEV